MRFIFCFVVVCFLSLSSLAEEGVVGGQEALQTQVLRALTNAVLYMRDNYKYSNLDAVTGLRILQAQLLGFQNEERLAAVPEIELLFKLAEETIDRALPHVKVYDPIYYKKLNRLADLSFWEGIMKKKLSADQEEEFVDQVLKLAELQKEISKVEGKEKSLELFDEDLSDQCLEEALSERCNISDLCIDMMTSEGVKGYTAAHQVYYFINIMTSNCLAEADRVTINELLSLLCARVYVESTVESKTWDIQQDLFMEQGRALSEHIGLSIIEMGLKSHSQKCTVGLCGLAGYYGQFSRTDWIEEILSWQRSSGCYGQADNFLSELQQLDEEHRFKRDALRVKREERIMGEGCLCHRTTVAIIALSQNFRALAELESFL